MKSLVTFAGVAIVLAAIGGLFYGAYLAAVYLWQVYAGLDDVLRVVLLSAMATVFIASIIVSGAIKSTALQTHRSTLAEAKLALYAKLVDACQSCFEAGSAPDYDVYRELGIRLAELDGELQVIAANAVLESHVKLSQAVRERYAPDEIRRLYQGLVKSLRRDLGHGPSFDESKLKFLAGGSWTADDSRAGQPASV